MATDTLNLGGRVFAAAAETTFEQDAWLMDLVYAHRLHEVVEAQGDVVAAVLRTGCVARFLAGFLVEVGQEWTPVAAREWERHFAQLRDPAGKAALHEAMEYLILGFFAAGRRSSAPSPSSSAPTASEETSTSQ